ncbi:hypothetical protein A7A08_02153 [Methyloligella halotolerans]|uniref:Uncharacterized protein n=1 Tax=Methyloligella halotolerans TaxID=1177755 RepID=A0A1E2RX87_9HYPH|nr:hypothetical protein [Methyloligella halotolerans]ODA66856.1 hypothetical protein A7A08_02153 [Methyloligella halotolerans]
MPIVEKVLLGAAGGLASLLVKFLGQDYPALQQFMQQGNETAVALMGYAYLILVGPLLFLGALVAYVVDETDPKKLLIAAISAPAMVTTWAGGPPAEAGLVQPAIYRNDRVGPSNEGALLSLFTPAYGQERDREPSSGAELVTFGNAVRMFFGTAPEGLAEAAARPKLDDQVEDSDDVSAAQEPDFDVIMESMPKHEAEETAERLQGAYPEVDVRIEPAAE